MIFILGGNGFVGSALARYCKKNSKDYFIINRVNYNESKGKKCDIFINVAGNSSKILAQKNPIKDFKESVELTKNSLIDFNFKKYVFISSCDIYPDCSSPDLTLENSKIDVFKQTHYGFHKYLAEQCVSHHSDNWLIIRLGGMVGPGLKKNAIYDIINGGPLWISPESQLQFIHTDDVARIVFSFIEKDMIKEIINLCGNGLIKIADIMQFKGNIPIQNDAPVVIYNVNIEKIKKYQQIPQSETSVKNFIREQLEMN